MSNRDDVIKYLLNLPVEEAIELLKTLNALIKTKAKFPGAFEKREYVSIFKHGDSNG